MLTISDDNWLYERCTRRHAGLRLAVAGGFAEGDLGVACYHSKTAAVELLLNHLVDGAEEYAVVDMIAGAEAFASGMFTRFDRTFLVCEPTLRSVGVFQQYTNYAQDYDVAISVIGNKVEDASDVQFLQDHVGDALFGWCGRSRYVKTSERGSLAPIEQLEPENLGLLERARQRLERDGKDWSTFTRQAQEFHRRNATAWGNSRTGVDLASQIDPEFQLGPQALPQSGQTPLQSDVVTVR